MNSTKKFLTCMLCWNVSWSVCSNAVAAVEDVLCLDMKISYSGNNVGRVQRSAISWRVSETRELNDMKLMLHAFDILKSFSDTYVSSSLYNRPDLLAISLGKLDLQKKLDELEAERQDVTEFLLKLEARRLDLREQKKELEANEADMKQELVWLEADISDLANKLTSFVYDKEVVQANLTELTVKRSSQQIELDKLNLEKNSLEEQITRAKDAINNGQGTVRLRASEGMKSLEPQLNIIISRVEVAQKEKDIVDVKFKKLTDRLSNLDTEIKATQGRSGRLAAKKDMMNRHLHTFGIKISHIEKELGDITLEIDAKNVRLGVSLEGAGSANPRTIAIPAQKQEIERELELLEAKRSGIEQGRPIPSRAIFTRISGDCESQKSAILEALTANDVARRADFRQSLNQICQACHREDVAFSCDVTWKSCFSDDMFNVLPFARSE